MVLNLQCASPEELDKILAAHAENKEPGEYSAMLDLYGPQILVRQFELPLSSAREINNVLKLEAAEVFSLLPEDIEISYHLMDSLAGRTKGVFVGISRGNFDSYMLSLENAKIITEAITANILSRLNYLLYENKIADQHACVIDFFKEGIINLSVFDNKLCLLLREIHYESLEDAQKEVLYSLKYVFSKSAYKRFDAVYLLGELSHKEELIASLKKELETDFKELQINTQLRLKTEDMFFDLNLLKKYSFSEALRRKIISAADIILVICALLFLTFAANTIKQSVIIKDLAASYKPADYKYAKGLLDRLDLLKDAK